MTFEFLNISENLKGPAEQLTKDLDKMSEKLSCSGSRSFSVLTIETQGHYFIVKKFNFDGEMGDRFS